MTQEDIKMKNWYDTFRAAMQPQQLPPTNPNLPAHQRAAEDAGKIVGLALFGSPYPKADNYDPSALTASMSNSEKPSYTDSQGNTIGADTVSQMLQNNQARINPTLNQSVINAFTKPIEGYGNNLTQTSGAGTYNSLADLANSQNSLVPDNSALRQTMNNAFPDTKISSILDYLKRGYGR